LIGAQPPEPMTAHYVNPCIHPLGHSIGGDERDSGAQDDRAFSK